MTQTDWFISWDRLRRTIQSGQSQHIMVLQFTQWDLPYRSIISLTKHTIHYLVRPLL